MALHSSLPPLEDSRRKSELSQWITKVKLKKFKYTHQRRKNLMVLSMLSNSLKKLKYLKKQEAKNIVLTPKSSEQVEERVKINLLDPEIIELDRSINDFMSKLKEIKTPVHR